MELEPKDDLALTDVLAPYREKIAETWAEVLISDAQQIGRWVAVGNLLNEAKAKGKEAGKNWITEVFPALCPADKPFGLGKAEKLMGIADTPELEKKNSFNWKILPPHLSALDALRKVDRLVGKEGTLARWIAGELTLPDGQKVEMHPDLEVNEIDAIVAKLAPRPEVDAAAAARDVAKTLGLKPNDPLVQGMLPKMGVEAPTPAAKQPEKKSAKPLAPWTNRDREEWVFVEAVREAVNHWVMRCPKDKDDQKKEYRLFPERKLTEILKKLQRPEFREWVCVADFVNGKWVPEPPLVEASPAPAATAAPANDTSKEAA